jgi:hypothetical protein
MQRSGWSRNWGPLHSVKQLGQTQPPRAGPFGLPLVLLIDSKGTPLERDSNPLATQ